MTINKINECFNNNPIQYRSILTFPRDLSFGLELELEKVALADVKTQVKSILGDEWKIKEDRSLLKDFSAEVNSPPLYNVRKTWKVLLKLGKLLERLNPSYEHCSFQINFDGNILKTDRDKIKFLKLYAVYEDIIYRFSQGDDGCYRSSLEDYASPIILCMKDMIKYDAILDFLSNQKRYGICIKSNNCNLIEFRTPNATSNPILWQNYITFFYYLLLYSLSSNCSEKKLDEYIMSFNKIYLLEYYQKPHEEKALTLANNLFKNSNDRIYFLQQYFNK